MRWIIKGRSAYGTEEIDEFDTEEEAQSMASEYRMAFGPGWSIWVEEG